MVEQGSQNNQFVVVEEPDSQGETREIWRGNPKDFELGTQALETARVFAVIEVDGVQVRKIPLDVSRIFTQGLQPA